MTHNSEVDRRMLTINLKMYSWLVISASAAFELRSQIDYVEERDGKIFGYEFKMNPKAKVKIPSNFVDTCHADIKVITGDNFRDFVGLN